MKVIVTCGPSYEPIDQVRRLTNFSTGELGVHLSNQLARAGFEVFCLKGSGATHPGPGDRCHLSLFDTNDDLLELLEQTSAAHEIAAVFHVAALCDYKVKRVEDDQGRSCNSPKIASRSGALTIHSVKSPAMEFKFPRCHMEVCWLENLSRTISARSASESASKRVVNDYLVGS